MATLPKRLRELLTLPTAAFVEDAVLDYLEDACRKLDGVKLKRDEHGNLLARYQRGDRPALALSAHTDHPGFVALEMIDKRTLRAAFRGWVESPYFVKTGVRFWAEDHWVHGKVTKILKEADVYRMIGRSARPEEVLIRVPEAVPVNAPGMWDLPDPQLRDDMVYARGCDDIAGVAALLTALERLATRKQEANLYALFTRAEEVGFIGAIGAARSGTLPKRVPIIAIETSKALLGASIGDGPILRVGDKSSIFTPEVTAFADRVGRELAKRKKSFTHQRKLMDGGTCESTAFYAYGYAAGGICVPLGNYHNMDERRRRIGSEYISLSDWTRMVDWFVALATDADGVQPIGATTRDQLEARFAQHEPLLHGESAGRAPKPARKQTSRKAAGRRR